MPAVCSLHLREGARHLVWLGISTRRGAEPSPNLTGFTSRVSPVGSNVQVPCVYQFHHPGVLTRSTPVLRDDHPHERATRVRSIAAAAPPAKMLIRSPRGSDGPAGVDIAAQCDVTTRRHNAESISACSIASQNAASAGTRCRTASLTRRASVDVHLAVRLLRVCHRPSVAAAPNRVG